MINTNSNPIVFYNLENPKTPEWMFWVLFLKGLDFFF